MTDPERRAIETVLLMVCRGSDRLSAVEPVTERRLALAKSNLEIARRLLCRVLRGEAAVMGREELAESTGERRTGGLDSEGGG